MQDQCSNSNSAAGAHAHHHACSCVQADVLADMYSLGERMLANWQSSSNSGQADWQSNRQSSSHSGQVPDEHFQALLLRAVSILLLNPWVDDDQTGRRHARHLNACCCQNVPHNPTHLTPPPRRRRPFPCPPSQTPSLLYAMLLRDQVLLQRTEQYLQIMQPAKHVPCTAYLLWDECRDILNCRTS